MCNSSIFTPFPFDGIYRGTWRIKMVLLIINFFSIKWLCMVWNYHWRIVKILEHQKKLDYFN